MQMSFEYELDQRFLSAVANLASDGPAGRPGMAGTAQHAPVPLNDEQLLALFDAQAGSRHLDLAARYLRAEGRGFYTIGSAGHEANAAVAAALRPTDPALLHYRSGAFYLARAAQVPGSLMTGSQALLDVLLGLTGARDEPIAGGRHKVFGHHDLAVIPQTSTIASHLPRAVGVAVSIDRSAKLAVGVLRDIPGLVVAVADGGFRGRIARVAAADSYVPLGDAANLVLVSEPEIEAAARRLLALHDHN